MRLRKSAFFTFCCSLIPGAGEMYMGFYKQGISLMSLFFGAFALGGWMGAEIVLAFLPVIWFFSFFHTHNLRGMTEDEFFKQEDRYFLMQDFSLADADEFFQKNKKVIAVALIFWGACMLTQICMDLLNPFFDGFLWDLAWRLNDNAAKIIVALGVVLGGFHILRKNKAVENEDAEGTEL